MGMGGWPDGRGAETSLRRAVYAMSDTRKTAERLATKWGVYVTSLDGEHFVLALEEAMAGGRDAALEEAAALVDHAGERVVARFLATRIRAMKGTR